MPACPVCRDDFEDGVLVCPTDDVTLVPRAQLPPAPVVEAQLGTFHPLTSGPVRRGLQHKGIPVRVVELDDDHQQLWVPGPVRDPLRAELTINWSSFLRLLEPDDQVTVAAAGGPQPGWYDAPQSSWLDNDGVLRVEGTPDEEDLADAQRTIGPALAVVGVIALLLAWVTDGSAALVTVGIGAIGVGLLLPR